MSQAVHGLWPDRIITGDGETVLEGRVVLINEAGIITGVELAGSLPSEVPVKRFSGCTLMPGMIDLHVHLGQWSMHPQASMFSRNPHAVMLLAIHNYQNALACGITALRSTAEPGGLGEALRFGLQAGYIRGPRYYSCEKAITITGGKCGQVDSIIQADGEDAVRAAVRRNIADGADWIKALAGYRRHICEYTQPEMDAIADETHRHGLRCCVHAATLPAIESAIKAGFDVIEHGCFMTPAMAQKAADNGIAWVPTLFIHQQAADYLEEKFISSGSRHNPMETLQIKYFRDCEAAFAENFKANAATGILIGGGTDAVFHDRPITPIADEVAALAKAGLGVLGAIRAATKNSAAILGQGTFGVIELGKQADILIIEGNPMEDLSVLKKVSRVYVGGELLYALTV